MANEIFVDTDGDSDITLGIYDFEKDDDNLVAPLPDITDETGDGFDDANLTQAESLAVINGAIFTDAVNVGSGTGNYNTFLALSEMTGGENPQDFSEQGFNSNDTNPLDGTNDEIDPSKTETVLLGAIPIQIINGVAYYEFRVDLNESNDSIDTQISLDQFRLYTSTNGDIQSTVDLFDTTAGDGDPAVTTLRYDMDAGHDISVLLSEANSSGSGNDDYAVLVPVSNFAGLDPATTYLYLYVQMGAADGDAGSSTSPWHAQGGFEEWNIQNALIIRGTKYEDLDGDGVQDPGEVGLAGVTIYIDDDLDGIAEASDGNGVIDAGEQTTVTDANGNWSFGGIPIFDNNYTIKIREVVPSGYFPTTLTSDQFGPYVQVLISSQATAGSILVAPSLFNQPLIDLSGTKYTDTDGDGVVDAGESGLGGVVIFIDMDNSGTLNGGDLSTTTAANGTWSFNDLSGAVIGKTVYEVLPDDYVQTLGTAGYDITGTATNLNFANFEKFDISGTKYEDSDGDGVVDAGETGLGGVVIFIDVDGSGTLNAGDLSTTTAADGTWSFTDLGTGYAGKKVYEVLPNGFVQTLGVAGYTITGTSGTDQTNLNFANFEKFDISGTKYNDLDGDGVVEAGETGLAGVVIFIDMDGSGTLTAGDLSTTTDVNGDWSFTDLGTGLAGKMVYEVVPTGYVQTLGTAGYAITGTSGTDQTDLDFANFDPNPVIDLEKFVTTDVSGGEQDADDPRGPIASTSTTVEFHVSLTNTGNVALTNITLSDSVVHTINGISGPPVEIDYNDPAYNAWVDLNGNGTQEAGEDWITADGDGDGILEGVVLDVGDTLDIYYSLTSELGDHENTASVTATAVLGGESDSDSDDANYYVLPSEDCVGVGTPGFWGRNGAQFWDGIVGNEKHIGDPNVDGDSDPGFADGELLYAVDSNNDGLINGSDQQGLLVGDFNHNGLNDEGNAIFISLETAQRLINASQKVQQDGKYMLGRDVVATWLNYLANGGSEGDTSCIDRPGTSDDGFNPQHYLTDAINWLQTYAGAGGNGNASDLGDNHRSESFDVFSLLTTAVKTNSSYWQGAVTNVADHSAASMHSALDAYNNTGVINGVEFCCDRDNADAMFALAQLSATP